MERTRRLSLTLLLVAPIITARRLSSEDLGISGKGIWSGFAEMPEDEWIGSTDLAETYYPEVHDGELEEDEGPWLRRKRALDTPGDDLETAEQVLFRPNFRYKHLVKEREKHHKLQEELRRQFVQNPPVSVASSPSVVAAPPPRTTSVHASYYNSYPQHSQTVYTPQVSTVQRVYSPQVSPSQRVYATNTPQRVPNYPIVQAASQYPLPLQYTINQGFRPQRSTYAYVIPHNIN